MSVPIPITALLLCGFVAGESFAQGTRTKFSTELITVKELQLTAAPLSEQASRCGIAFRDLETPAQAVFGKSTIRLTQPSTNIVFVKTNVVAAGEVCAASVDVELFRWSNEYRVSVSVWARESVIAGGRDGFNERIREKVEALTREFIADWEKARR